MTQRYDFRGEAPFDPVEFIGATGRVYRVTRHLTDALAARAAGLWERAHTPLPGQPSASAIERLERLAFARILVRDILRELGDGCADVADRDIAADFPGTGAGYVAGVLFGQWVARPVNPTITTGRRPPPPLRGINLN